MIAISTSLRQSLSRYDHVVEMEYLLRNAFRNSNSCVAMIRFWSPAFAKHKD